MLALKKVLRKQPREEEALLPKGISEYWSFEQISPREYILRLKSSIAQTGAEVTSTYTIPLHHRVMEVYAYHYDSTGVLNSDALTFRWYTRDGDNWRLMLQELDAAYTSFGVSYQDEEGGGRELNPGQYQFKTTTTNTHLVAVSIRLEVLHA